MDRLFTLDMPAARFARNVLLVSVAALLPVLALHVALTPGFAAALAEGGPALPRYLRQVATNGIPVVFVVNFVGFALFARAAARPRRDPARLILADMAARIAVFVLVHVAVYVVSSDWFGSFGGSRLTALTVVAPTLARAALFDNVSGVYLYATVVSALPLYAVCSARSPRLSPLVRRLPGRSGAVLLAAAFFAIAVLALTGLAQLAMAVKPG